MVVDKSLFADDTSVVENEKELGRGVEITEEVMAKFEERNNEDKEEQLIFGDASSGQIRMLGSWMSWDGDVKKRLERGNRAWWKVRNRLRGTRISKRMQARVVEAGVESTLLFDRQARTWRIGEIRKLQSMVDKAYRWVWCGGKGPALRVMKEKGVNMVDVRKELGVMSLR